MKVKDIRLLSLANLRQYKPKHYIDIGLPADWVSGEPRVMEPDKVEGREWFDLDNLPSPLFGVIPILKYAAKIPRSITNTCHTLKKRVSMGS